MGPPKAATEESRKKHQSFKESAMRVRERIRATTTVSLEQVHAAAAAASPGPLDALRRWHAAGSRVSVTTRHAGGVRGVATGTLAAYDRFMNVVLRDVTERYSVPVRRVKERSKLVPAPVAATAPSAAAAAPSAAAAAAAAPSGMVEVTRTRVVRRREVRQRQLGQVFIKGDNVVEIHSAAEAAAGAGATEASELDGASRAVAERRQQLATAWQHQAGGGASSGPPAQATDGAAAAAAAPAAGKGPHGSDATRLRPGAAAPARALVGIPAAAAASRFSAAATGGPGAAGAASESAAHLDSQSQGCRADAAQPGLEAAANELRPGLGQGPGLGAPPQRAYPAGHIGPAHDGLGAYSAGAEADASRTELAYTARPGHGFGGEGRPLSGPGLRSGPGPGLGLGAAPSAGSRLATALDAGPDSAFGAEGGASASGPATR